MFGGNNNASMGPADFAAMMGGAGNVFGNGGEGFWILIILFALFGWGGNGFGGNGGGRGSYPVIYGAGGAGGNELYPWLNQSQTQAQGFANISTQLCNGFGNIQTTLANGFAGVESGANARQIANMQTAFDAQTAMMQGFNGVQGQLAQCCCDNRLATCQTQNIVQNEGNATRFADANNTRDIIDSQTRGTQAILDKLCSLELDAKNDTIAQLRSELLYARGQASQDVQTAVLRQSEVQTANQLVQELRSCPIPSMPVYGQTPIFTCSQNQYGCGCNGGI